MNRSRILLILAGVGGVLFLCICGVVGLGLALLSLGSQEAQPATGAPAAPTEVSGTLPAATAAAPVTGGPSAPSVSAKRMLLQGDNALWLFDPNTGEVFPLSIDRSPAFDDPRIRFSATGTYMAYLSVEATGSNAFLTLVTFPGLEATDLTQAIQTSDPGQSFPYFVPHSPFAWAPQEEMLAYVAQGQKGTTDVYVYDPRAQQSRLLVETPAHATDLAWSPDGRYLFYADLIWKEEEMSSEVQRLGIWDRNTGETVQVPFEGTWEVTGWLDGRRVLLFNENVGALALLDVDGNVQRMDDLAVWDVGRVQGGRALLSVGSGGTLDPGIYVWSPEGTPQRLFDKAEPDLEDVSGRSDASFILYLGVVTLSGEVYPAPQPVGLRPAFSPQGLLAWVGADQENLLQAQFFVVVQDPKGGQPEVRVPVEPFAFLAWQPDGQALWGASAGDLYRMAPPDFRPQQVAEVADAPEAAFWVP